MAARGMGNHRGLPLQFIRLLGRVVPVLLAAKGRCFSFSFLKGAQNGKS
jgi:hypothetical protein